MDTVPLLEVVQALERKLADNRPHVVFTHHRGDLNIDHEIVARAVETATRPGSGATPEEVYAFEVPSSTDWSFADPRRAFHPNHFVDVTGSLAFKVEALKAYASEIRPFPHPRSQEAIEALARARGAQGGLHAAEAFSLVRRIVR
jgi:LmbE family N-acetylglucosaminyl deacetylase